MSTKANGPIPDSPLPSKKQTVTGTKSRWTRELDFSTPISHRLPQLINNDYLSDVVFSVGKAKQLIYAHKLIITLGSEVFYAQLSGHFAEAKTDKDSTPVDVTDIEPDIFTEMLKHFYHEQVEITASNMLDIYYASEKYLLDILSRECEDEFSHKINDDNVLDIFEHNRKYKFDMVDTICLDIICDNPLKFFKQKGFLNLSHEGLLMINERTAINCEKEQLQDAVQSWEGENGASSIVFNMKDVLCEKLHFFSDTKFSTNIDTSFRLTVTSPIYLYGIGVLVGAQSQIDTLAEIEIIVVVKNELMVSKKVPLLRHMRTYDIMFERKLIDTVCNIQISIKKPSELENVNLLHFTKFQLASTDIQTKCGVTCAAENSTSPNARCNYCLYDNTLFVNCMAYLMCQDMTKPLKKQ